ncbi:MAG: DUF481 domain-containing protein [Bdellovibrionales bacterium]|nr:DUF481 domain-containing protein [Bdellovibrionales bacterium]
MKHLSFLVVCGLAIAFSALAEEEGGQWAHKSQLGIALSGGNSDSQTYSVKQDTRYSWTGNILKSSGHYLFGKAAGVAAAENWHLDLRYERELSEHFSVYAGPGIEGDFFSGFSNRINLGLGGKYWILPGDKKNNYFFVEAGYLHQKQNNIGGTVTNSNFIRTYAEAGKSITDAVSGKVYVEVLPDLSQGLNLLVNFEPSIAVALSSHFSMQLAFTGRYDGLPNAGKKNFDWQYTTSLVASY